MTPRRSLTYVDGVGAGIATLAIIAAFWLAHATRTLGVTYAVIGDLAVPAITRVVLHPVWTFGVPAALAAALVVAHLRRPRHALVGLAVVAVLVDAGWYYAAWAPVFELAGNIR